MNIELVQSNKVIMRHKYESFLWRIMTSFYCTNSIFIPTSSKIKFNSPVIRMDFSKLPIRRLSTTINVFKNDRRTWKPYYNNRHGWQRCKHSKITMHRYFRWISSFESTFSVNRLLWRHFKHLKNIDLTMFENMITNRFLAPKWNLMESISIGEFETNAHRWVLILFYSLRVVSQHKYRIPIA